MAAHSYIDEGPAVYQHGPPVQIGVCLLAQLTKRKNANEEA